MNEEVDEKVNERIVGYCVRWTDKGFGFIRCQDGAEVFVHWSSIDMPGYKRLYEDDEVEFSIEEGPKGPYAVDVRKLN